MERQTETTVDPTLIRYCGVIQRLRELHSIRVVLQKALHARVVTSDFFLEGHRIILEQIEAAVVDGARLAVNSDHGMTRSAAFDVLTSFATTNSVGLTKQKAFLRNTDIGNFLNSPAH